jgi:peptidyl-prolyl cis-trans isomerase B (cyclophilin B)
VSSPTPSPRGWRVIDTLSVMIQQRMGRAGYLVISAAVLAVSGLLAGTVWFGLIRGSRSSLTAVASKASATPPASAAPPAVPCQWVRDPGQPSIGTPPAGEPRSGTALMTVTTNLGVIEIAIDRTMTPCTAASFAYLAERQFFDGSVCHRLVTEGIYVLQCGDPTGTGKGTPGYRFANENLPPDANTMLYRRGTVAVANSGPDTNGSQFFIVYRDSPIKADSPPFGTVVKGLDIIDRVSAGGVTRELAPTDGPPKIEVRILSLRIT